MTKLAGWAVMSALLGVVPAWADKPVDKGRGKGKVERSGVSFGFTMGQREAVQAYFAEQHGRGGRGGCPPGLAKKGNGCLPPGQAKKLYSVGRAVPRDVVLGDLPRELSARLGTPPTGYAYAVVDGDLVKLAVGTKLVVDAIEGLVH